MAMMVGFVMTGKQSSMVVAKSFHSDVQQAG